MGGPHNFVVAPPIPIEDIACTAAFAEGNPMVVGFLPSREKTAELQERVGSLTVDPGGDRRIHRLTLLIGTGAAEVIKDPRI
jgi:hypothetical protein